jgi:hypothetical protein
MIPPKAIAAHSSWNRDVNAVGHLKALYLCKTLLVRKL